MVETIVGNLSAIFFGLAALVTAAAAFVSVWFNRNKLIEIDKKVDGGLTQLQDALAEIAKMALLANKRSADGRVSDRDVKP